MKLGIKVNADVDSVDRIAQTNPSMVEVWFNVNNAPAYTDLFEALKKRHIDVGLHFWGMLDDQIAPNITYPDSNLINQSMNLMRQTIDIAAANHFHYVNIHPGAAAKSKVYYDKQYYEVISDPVDVDTAIQTFLTNAQTLNTYAKGKNVIFTVETVPIRVPIGWYDAKNRLNAQDTHELPVQAIVLAAAAGLFVANDFSHTAANVITDDPNAVWTFLLDTTKQLAPQTKLIHLGFVIPPFNGTDIHDSLDNPLLDTNQAVPNKKQMIELLQLFQNRDDVWILVEPHGDHVKNFFFAQKLLDQALKI